MNGNSTAPVEVLLTFVCSPSGKRRPNPDGLPSFIGWRNYSWLVLVDGEL